MRNSKRIRTAIYCAGSILILFSCAKDPTEIERTPTSTFPLTADSRWEYSGLWYKVPFNDSSLADTVRREIYRHIIGTDSLHEFADLVICDDTIITYVFGQVDTFINRQWLKMEDDKLKLFAHDEYPIGNEPNPYVYDNPRILLDLPLSGGKTWVAWTFNDFFENKTVVGIDYLQLPTGWNYCDVIRADIVGLSNDTITKYEWYEDDGLMRYEIDLGVSIEEDDNGFFLDSVRIFEVWDIIDMEISDL
ncbi:MAG: hypothetical protein JSU85_02170 [Candidatus Zixiibacteriota bacterium]|nr:MAG: hypothetical protein JSU85_02170 [candidate division Zixibacteria bacterium]